MPQLYVSAVTGTAATLFAIILVLLRAKFQGRRPVLGLIRRWVATGTRTSGLVLALLSAIGVYSFTRIPSNEWSELSSASPLGVFVGAPSMQGTAFLADGSSRDAQAMEALRTYAGNIDTKRQSIAAIPPPPEPVELSNVEEHSSMIRSMVDQLATRLETSPNDEDGWLLLMRSHMTLGEKDAAKAALTKALGTFASDAAVKTRLTAAARELGVESN